MTGVNEFERGDVIIKIGYTVKWVVTGPGDGCSHALFTYTTRRVEEGILGSPDAFSRTYCNERYVKVGTWDFEKNKEMEDEAI